MIRNYQEESNFPDDISQSAERVAIRRMLRQTLVADADFEAFCADCFHQVQLVYFASGMQRLSKENILLQHARVDEVRTALLGWLNSLAPSPMKSQAGPRESETTDVQLAITSSTTRVHGQMGTTGAPAHPYLVLVGFGCLSVLVVTGIWVCHGRIQDSKVSQNLTSRARSRSSRLVEEVSTQTKTSMGPQQLMDRAAEPTRSVVAVQAVDITMPSAKGRSTKPAVVTKKRLHHREKDYAHVPVVDVK